MSGLRIPFGLYWQTRFYTATRRLWQWLGALESRVLREDIDQITVRAPIYVCGLARSGTTIMTECLNSHPSVTSHRYSDFPFTDIPYWTNWLRQRSRVGTPVARQRAHADRIEVTADSPEAIEEVLWRAWRPALQAQSQDDILDSSTDCPAFEHVYLDHIRKLLLVRQSSRYLCKGNYHVSRIGYLHKLHPDACFVIMIRHPHDHLASMQKQHALFSREPGSRSSRRIERQLAASGHFEFGPGRQAICIKPDVHRQILHHWQHGEELEGWARYWSSLYAHLHAIRSDPVLGPRCLVVRYEDLCDASASQLTAVLEHCALDRDSFATQLHQHAERLSPPTYYQQQYPDDDLALIRSHCATVAALYGYTL